MRAALPAAVLHADDPLARDVASTVPRTATVRKVGACIVGYDKPPLHGEPAPAQQRYSLVEMTGRGRRKALRALVQLRRSNGVVIEDIGYWAAIVADIAACIFGASMTAKNVEGQAAFIGLDIAPATLAPFAAAWAARRRAEGEDFRPISNSDLGRMVRLDWRERDELNLVRITAHNETAEECRRRRNRERMARKRAEARAAQTFKPWEILGVSKATYYRRETKSVRVSSKEGSAHKNSLIPGKAHAISLTVRPENGGASDPHGKCAQKQSHAPIEAPETQSAGGVNDASA